MAHPPRGLSRQQVLSVVADPPAARPAIEDVFSGRAKGSASIGSRGLGEVQVVGLDGGGEVSPLAGGEGENQTVRVLGVPDGDVLLVWGAGEHREFDTAPAGSIAVAALAPRDAGQAWCAIPRPPFASGHAILLTTSPMNSAEPLSLGFGAGLPEPMTPDRPSASTANAWLPSMRPRHTSN